MKPQIIRITGPDGVGKSTMCFDLITHFGHKGYNCAYVKAYDEKAKEVHSPEELDNLGDQEREEFFVSLSKKQIELAVTLKNNGFIVFMDGSWERSYTFALGRKVLSMDNLNTLYRGLGVECENAIDCTFFLSVDSSLAKQRMGYRSRLTKLDQSALDNFDDIISKFFLLKEKYKWSHIDTREIDSKRALGIISKILEKGKIQSVSEYLGKILLVKIDRPLGSFHPKYTFPYLVNYGYIENSLGQDGEEVDAYILGVNEPLKEFQGKCIAVIHRINDSDDKLIVVPEAAIMTDSEIISLTNFQEQYFESEIIR